MLTVFTSRKIQVRENGTAWPSSCKLVINERVKLGWPHFSMDTVFCERTIPFSSMCSYITWAFLYWALDFKICHHCTCQPLYLPSPTYSQPPNMTVTQAHAHRLTRSLVLMVILLFPTGLLGDEAGNLQRLKGDYKRKESPAHLPQWPSHAQGKEKKYKELNFFLIIPCLLHLHWDKCM